MIILGLTGSIGMGKSATARLFAERGIPVHDADAVVHQAYAKGGEAAAPLEWAFPGVVSDDGSVDRKLLRERVVNDTAAMKRLEAIIHPIVGDARDAFMKKAHEDKADIVVLDVPLLFETGGDARVDAIVVVSTSKEVQRARVLARGGMTEAEFEAILARQLPDSQKRERADFTINTGFGFEYAQVQVDEVLKALRAQKEAPEGQDASCAKLHSTPKQPDSTPPTVSASSKSDASS